MCDDDTRYETAEELVQEHWKQNCTSSIFEHIYRICKICGTHRRKDASGKWLTGAADHVCEEQLKLQVREMTNLVRGMREQSELEAATLNEMEKSAENVDAEEKAKFFNLATSLRPQDCINLLNSWENWYENGPPKISQAFNERRKQMMPEKLWKEFTKKTRKREVAKRGPERCTKGHALKMMRNTHILRPNEDDEKVLIKESSKQCSFKNCIYQEEGKNPEIDFLAEKFYACQFVYTCFFAVHADCYGGEQQMDMEDFRQEEVEVEEQESEEEEEPPIKMTSYIEELGPIDEEETDTMTIKVAVCGAKECTKNANKVSKLKRVYGFDKKKAKHYNKPCSVCQRAHNGEKDILYVCDVQDCSWKMCSICATCEKGHTLVVATNSSGDTVKCGRKHFQPRFKPKTDHYFDQSDMPFIVQKG